MSPPCLHKYADHQCGTNARARLDGCRCDPCVAARRAYDRKWKRSHGEFPTAPPLTVPAGKVHRHVTRLMDQGMGPKRIAEVSGVPHGAISKLVYGDYSTGRIRSKRVKRATAEKLLAVGLDLADGAKVPAIEAKAIVRELLRRGWSKAEIGRRVHGLHAKSLQAVRTPLVQAGTLRVLRALLTEPVPLRVHSPSGGLYQPVTAHKWQIIEPTTPGVPSNLDHIDLAARAPGSIAELVADVLETEYPSALTLHRLTERVMGIRRDVVPSAVSRALYRLELVERVTLSTGEQGWRWVGMTSSFLFEEVQVG